MDLQLYNDFSLFNDMDRRFRALTNKYDLAFDVFKPHPVDIVEFKDHYEVVADAPGFTIDDIVVEQTGEYLSVKGEKKHENNSHGGKVHRHERGYSTFSRLVKIPEDVVKESISAKLNNGILSVFLPKNENVSKNSTRRIAITRN